MLQNNSQDINTKLGIHRKLYSGDIWISNLDLQKLNKTGNFVVNNTSESIRKTSEEIQIFKSINEEQKIENSHTIRVNSQKNQVTKGNTILVLHRNVFLKATTPMCFKNKINYKKQPPKRLLKCTVQYNL